MEASPLLSVGPYININVYSLRNSSNSYHSNFTVIYKKKKRKRFVCNETTTQDDIYTYICENFVSKRDRNSRREVTGGLELRTRVIKFSRGTAVCDGHNHVPHTCTRIPPGAVYQYVQELSTNFGGGVI